MPFYPRYFSILILVGYRVFLSTASVACYNPDQIVPDLPYLPCDTASGVHSACCAHGDACTSNGYCLGNSGYPYRGGCTDITWNSPNCCPGCRDTNIDNYGNLYPCSTANGSSARKWCCGTASNDHGTGVGCCSGSTVFEPDFGAGPLLLALENATNPNPSTPATSSSLFTTSPRSVTSSLSLVAPEPAPTPTKTQVEPSSNPSQPSRSGVALGTGIGVPVGALLLCGLVLLFVRERRLRIRAHKMTHALRAAQSIETTGVQSHGISGPSLPQELDHVEHRPEILSQEVYEANGRF